MSTNTTTTSKPLKPKRGTTAQNNNYTGEAYEVTLDTEKHTLRVHDGVTAGGFPLAKSAELQALAESIDDNVGTIREDTVAAAQLAASMSQGETGSLTLEGVAAEVERKAALDLSNLSAAGRSLAAGLGMPSGSRYVDLTLGANGSRYTAPANGWFTITKVTENAGEMVGFASTSTEQRIITYGPSYSKAWVSCYMPALKGHEVIAEYNATGATQFFRFIYAEGEEA